jgi:hypothetical protein
MRYNDCDLVLPAISQALLNAYQFFTRWYGARKNFSRE